MSLLQEHTEGICVLPRDIPTTQLIQPDLGGRFDMNISDATRWIESHLPGAESKWRFVSLAVKKLGYQPHTAVTFGKSGVKVYSWTEEDLRLIAAEAAAIRRMNQTSKSEKLREWHSNNPPSQRNKVDPRIDILIDAVGELSKKIDLLLSMTATDAVEVRGDA